jgi:two-component system chemotaxis sensor kinase CheA
MKIRTKLLLAVSILPAFLLVSLFLAWMQNAQLDKTSDSVKISYEAVNLATGIREKMRTQGIELRNLVIFTDEAAIEQELQSLQQDNNRASENLNRLEVIMTTPEQKELLASLKLAYSDFTDFKNNVIALVLQNKKEEAAQFIYNHSEEIQTEYIKGVSAITETFGMNLKGSLDNMVEDFRNGLLMAEGLLVIVMMIVTVSLFHTLRGFFRQLKSMSAVMGQIATGKTGLSSRVEVRGNNEIDHVAESFNTMAEVLGSQQQKEQELTWGKTNLAQITTSLSGTKDLETLGQTFLSKIVPLTESSHAVFYVKEMGEHHEDPVYQLIASYAFKERKHILNRVRAGEGLIGQAIFEKEAIILTHVPPDYVQITSGLGAHAPLNLYVLPICFEGEVKAVLELASFKPYDDREKHFLEELAPDLGIILESVMSRIQLADLLAESQALMEEVQAQAEELETQQEELRETNEELEEQTCALRQSEERLQRQQEELEQTNKELEEQAKSLREQNSRFEKMNQELEKARAELEAKAEQLTLSSKYKSEFLANISHELRTPLNSLLILSKLLVDNPKKNLTPKQVEYAKTIYSSGNDLLSLINDLLDLAKIESGKMTVNAGKMVLSDVAAFVESYFKPVADEKRLPFRITIDDDVPSSIYSDEVRVEQVLKNLLSNAFKFTSEGEVRLEISTDKVQGAGTPMIAFAVTDTGIGIPEEKKQIIFNAFQQADGTTSRKYGGTGLGLSISKEIAELLGGKITVSSQKGKGSTFTFYVGDYNDRLRSCEAEAAAQAAEIWPSVHTEAKRLSSQTGASKVLEATEQAEELEQAETAINRTFSFSSEPPEADTGESVPTVSEQFAGETFAPENGGLKQPGFEYSHIKRLLIVDDDIKQRNSLMELVGNMDFVIKAVSSGSEAIEEMKVNHFDCMILDLGLTDTCGFDLLKKVKEHDKENKVKVFIYTGRDLTSKEEYQLGKFAHTIIIKNEHSPERLLDELQLYLNEGSQKRPMPNRFAMKSEDGATALKGKQVLLVDDDVRNVFALTNILELNGMKTIFAENGREGLEQLLQHHDIDLVLMDIMMPEMDGFEAMKNIRRMPQFQKLPIIAITAKAMKEDREKCMEAGASDYITKPIEPDQFISLVKVWLYE